MHYVYILQCRDRTLYTGYTVNVQRRIKIHNEGQGAKYTRGRTPVRLVYAQVCPSKSDALRREREIKKLSRIQKLRLIQSFSTSDIELQPTECAERDTTAWRS